MVYFNAAYNGEPHYGRCIFLLRELALIFKYGFSSLMLATTVPPAIAIIFSSVEMADTRCTRCAPEQDISSSHGGPRADSRVTRYFAALRSHARPRFLGDIVLAIERERGRGRKREREREKTGEVYVLVHATRTRVNTKRERRKLGARDCVRARAGILKRRPSDFGSLPYNNFNNPGPQLQRD